MKMNYCLENMTCSYTDTDLFIFRLLFTYLGAMDKMSWHNNHNCNKGFFGILKSSDLLFNLLIPYQWIKAICINVILYEAKNVCFHKFWIETIIAIASSSNNT